MSVNRVKQAIQALTVGKPIILTDDTSRENEGDLIYAAGSIDAQQINFMLQCCSGIVCLSIDDKRAKQLGLSLMVGDESNTSRYKTPFTTSIEAKHGVTTGVSAADRAQTIKAAMCESNGAESISTPGHVFPLIAHEYGVLGRRGHTEGSLDLVKLAGLASGAVLCELMNQDGTMMKGEQITCFADQHDIPVLSIEEICHYRLKQERHLEKTAETTVNFKKLGLGSLSYFRNKINGQESIVVHKPFKGVPYVRIHSACFTGDLLGSLHCDCQSQLRQALDLIADHGGFLIYLPQQEGRGIGLENKIKAYALQRDENLDTLEANLKLGFLEDMRDYHDAAQILRFYGVEKCNLLTNNPKKIDCLRDDHGIAVEVVATKSNCNEHNIGYLKTKATQLKHSIEGI